MSENLFENLNISPELKRAVREMGYENATKIQAETIPLILEGHDVIGRSHTGTGKTAAFGIPAVELVDGNNKRDVQALIICPTRELAVQNWEEIKKLYKYKTGVKAAVVYGGQQIDRQIKELKRGVNIVIGTPGRIMDHLHRKTLWLDKLKMVVLDEADEMLNMGFRDDIDAILKKVPEERQTILFSATMPPEILAITKQYQKDPKIVEVDMQSKTLDEIEQFYCEAPMMKKPEALIELLKRNKPSISIIFCNTKKMVDSLCSFLNKNGYEALGIHGNMRQNARNQVMGEFKSGNAPILVATDVAARGIDAHDIDAVINFDIPQNTEYYIHRIGRTGRAGKSGRAFTIVSGRKQFLQLKDIEREIKKQITYQDITVAGFPARPMEMPTEEEHGRRSRMTSAGRKPYRDKSIENKERIEGSHTNKNHPLKPHQSGEDFSRIVINLGREQHITPNHLVGAIAEKTSLSGSDIGKIEISGKTSVVEVPAAQKQEVIDAMTGSKIKGFFVEAKQSEDQFDKKPNYRRPRNPQRYPRKAKKFE